MKKITTLCAVVAMAFCQMLPAGAQSEVHITFSRGGTDASSVTVNVKDASGNAIEGASATLESVQKGSGLNVFTGLSTTTLNTGNNLDTDKDVLCAAYDNKQNGFTQFTFKLQGLDDYAYQDAEMKVATLNSGGTYQGPNTPREYTFQMWNTNEISADNALYTLNVTTSGNPSGEGNDNTKAYQLTGSTVNFTSSSDQYLIVRLTRTAALGCFAGLREITLKQKTYTATATPTNNLGNVATFSAAYNVTFDDNTTAYIATESSDNSVTLSKLNGNVLKANDGAILISTGTEITATPTSSESSDSRTNLLVGSGDATKELTAGSYYILNKQSDNAVFSLLGSSSTTLAANKAALATTTGNSNALNIRFDGTTGIASAASSLNAATGSRIYNLQGQAVTGKLAKGVYVMGGKKFIVK